MKPGDLIKFSWSNGSWTGLIIELRHLEIYSKERESPFNIIVWRPDRDDIQEWLAPWGTSKYRIEVMNENR